MNEYSKLQEAFDPKSFRTKGHALIDQLADLITQTQNGNGLVTMTNKPDDLHDYWRSLEGKRLNTHDLYQKIIEQSIKLHHPHFVGHQVSSPAPIGALSSLLSSMLNNGMGIYEMGEGATALEKVVVNIFCKQIGYNDGDGLLTSGGTLANLTALLAARSLIKGADIWNKGTKEKYCIMVSEVAHYCIDRAVRIMGWGAEGIIKIPVNDDYQMDITLLPKLYKKAKSENKIVLAVVGSAPCTATGTYDDLDKIADFCEAENIWFHIDGAHGGPAIFSKKYKYLMKGSERADSIVIDAHKMMLTPAIATALLFKKSSDSYNTFSQKASYLWESQEKQEWYNLARRTFECTKFMMSIKIYSIINEYGLEIFDQFVTRQYNLARDFAKMINSQPDFHLALEPHSNIVCFRYSPDEISSDSKLSEINRRIRKSMYEDGIFYLVQTELNNGLHLRVTLMNAFTTLDHLNNMLDLIRKKAKELVTE